ncbi:MAG: DUF1266 domain-containing protein [Alistipes sp.]|jgi:hypothetical protein|nr:DUF1266 domain-containing protein [Alistipes sp.]
MKELDENAVPILEVVVPTKRILLFIKVHNHFRIYDDRIDVEYDNSYDVIALRNVVNIHINEAVAPYTSRTTEILYNSEGEELVFDLPDSVFDGLSFLVEEYLSRVPEGTFEWLDRKRSYPDTIRWLNAMRAVYSAAQGNDFELFGGRSTEPEYLLTIKKTLYEYWGINNRQDLLVQLDRLFEGPTVALLYRLVHIILNFKTVEEAENYIETELDGYQKGQIWRFLGNANEELCRRVKEISDLYGAKSIWAWDLERYLVLCDRGYTLGWMTPEEAMERAVAGAQRLQQTYSGWDDAVGSYLHGYGFWFGEDLDDPKTEAHRRRAIFESLKKVHNSPYKMRWDQELSVADALGLHRRDRD